ncbi:MAG: hypothetical protein SFU56_21625 [Capsulimonadales bacterium]|nr:hypothetical protein [Capsulimonadales bacterium]
MMFGRQPQGDAPVLSPMAAKSARGLLRGVRWLLATLLVFIPVLMSAGCGGSSSSGPGQPSGNQAARVVGRLVDFYSDSAPVVGATVTLQGRSVITGADGTFTLSVAAGQGTTNLTIQPPTSINFYGTGVVGGQPFDLRSEGVSVPTLTVDQNYSVGDILMYSEAGPPPPPRI